MRYQGQEIQGNFNYIRKGETGVLDIFANILKQSENSVTIERFNNFGRHRLPMVTKSLKEFENDYRQIGDEEKQ